VAAVLWKDALTEARGRDAMAATALFAVTATVVVAFAAPAGLSSEDAPLASAFFWIILFFAVSTGALRVFMKEEDARTALALRLAARPSAVLAGKLLFNAGVGLALTSVIAVLFLAGVFRATVPHPGLFAAVALAGGAGLSGACTAVAAIVARASARGPLFTVLAFPVVAPLFIPALHATTLALTPSNRGAWLGAEPGAAGNDLIARVSYLVSVTLLSGLLFESIWTD
jgi:heme exporter protein B